MEKPNRPGKIGFFINAFLSICLTILQHKEFILNDDGSWLKLFLYFKLKCKICYFNVISIFYMRTGLWTPTYAKLFYSLHC